MAQRGEQSRVKIPTIALAALGLSWLGFLIVGAIFALAAMGVDPTLARGAIRISVGFATTESDIDRCLDAWIRVQSALLKDRRGLAA